MFTETNKVIHFPSYLRGWLNLVEINSTILDLVNGILQGLQSPGNCNKIEMVFSWYYCSHETFYFVTLSETNV